MVRPVGDDRALWVAPSGTICRHS